MYLLIKYIKSFLWRVVKRLSHIEDARCLKINTLMNVLSETVYEPIIVGLSASNFMEQRNITKVLKVI